MMTGEEFIQQSLRMYEITCTWGPRADTPDEIAPRFLRMLEGLSEIDPAFGDWYVGHKRGVPLASLSPAKIVRYIFDGGEPDGRGGVHSKEGYSFGAHSGRARTPRTFKVSIRAGRTLVTKSFINTASIRTQPLCAENASLLSLPVLKSALLVLVSQWAPIWGGLSPWALANLEAKELGSPPRYRGHFNLAWVTYLSPRFAAMVTPPASCLSEHLPDGGLLMIATEERFSVDNPLHMAAARDIAAALAPVNALPWPLDAEP